MKTATLLLVLLFSFFAFLNATAWAGESPKASLNVKSATTSGPMMVTRINFYGRNKVDVEDRIRRWCNRAPWMIIVDKIPILHPDNNAAYGSSVQFRWREPGE